MKAIARFIERLARAWHSWYGTQQERERRRIRCDARRHGGVAYFPGDNRD